MYVHALEYLLLIAETGSLSEAAEKAHLSQPAMTQCLAKLEREAGWPLFNRVNRKLVPTRAGQIYLKGAREMVQIKEETYQSIEQLRRQQGQLRVTGSADICYLLEEKLLPKLYLQFPQLKVERMVTTTHTAKQYLTNGLADLSFLCAVKPSSLLEYVPLLHDTLCLAVPESMISAEIRAGGLAACGCLPFVLPDEQQFGRELVDRLFRREHLYPISLYTAAGWKDLVRLADEGYGAAILPERSAARLEHCEVLPLENAPSFDFVCAVPRYAEPSPACMALIELARKHFATHG